MKTEGMLVEPCRVRLCLEERKRKWRTRPNKTRIGVVLTADARKVLRSEPIQLFLKEGQILQLRFHFTGRLFSQHEVEASRKKESCLHEIAIPISYVLYMVSAEAQARLGLSKEN